MALPGPGHYEQDDGMEITCGFGGIRLEKLELSELDLGKNGKTGDVKRDAKMIDGKVEMENQINLP